MMNPHAQVGPAVYSQITPDQKLSRLRSLKIFGGIHIGLGVICAVLSLVGLIISSGDQQKDRCKDYYRFNSYYMTQNYNDFYSCRHAQYVIIFTAVSMAFSGWFILTGFIPLCMTENRQSKWRCLKTAFLVLNIIGSVSFAPTVFSLGIVGSIMSGSTSDNSATTAITACLALFSFIEFVVAIISASFCCCCSQLTSSNSVGVVFENQTQSGIMYGIQQTQMSPGYPYGMIPLWGSNGQQLNSQGQGIGYAYPGLPVNQQQQNAQHWGYIYPVLWQPVITQQHTNMAGGDVNQHTPNMASAPSNNLN